jgi:hypothetical protein
VDFWEKKEKKKEKRKKKNVSRRALRTKEKKKEKVRACVLKRGVEPRTFRELNISSF